jgi:hypothetical protein
MSKHSSRRGGTRDSSGNCLQVVALLLSLVALLLIGSWYLLKPTGFGGVGVMLIGVAIGFLVLLPAFAINAVSAWISHTHRDYRHLRFRTWLGLALNAVAAIMLGMRFAN